MSLYSIIIIPTQSKILYTFNYTNKIKSSHSPFAATSESISCASAFTIIICNCFLLQYFLHVLILYPITPCQSLNPHQIHPTLHFHSYSQVCHNVNFLLFGHPYSNVGVTMVTFYSNTFIFIASTPFVAAPIHCSTSCSHIPSVLP